MKLACSLQGLAVFCLAAACAPSSFNDGSRTASKSISEGLNNHFFDYHSHLAAVLSGKRLLALADQHGQLEKGLRGLSLPPDSSDYSSREVARKRLESTTIPHDEYYASLNLFCDAAFGNNQSEQVLLWLAESVESLARNGQRGAYLLSSVNKHRQVVSLMQSKIEKYQTIFPLLNIARNRLSDRLDEQLDREEKKERQRFEESLSFYREKNEAKGFGIVTPELYPRDEDGFVDVVLEKVFEAWKEKSKRFSSAPLVLMVHAGEGYVADDQAETLLSSLSTGQENVAFYLQKVLEFLQANFKEKCSDANEKELNNFELIMAHAARINDLPAVEGLLADLHQLLGHPVVINVNPLSNLAYRMVDKLADIAAYKLPSSPAFRLAVGTDNVGTLQQNLAVHRLILARQFDEAQRQAEAILKQLREGSYDDAGDTSAAHAAK